MSHDNDASHIEHIDAEIGIADLSYFDSIRGFAAEIVPKRPHTDVGVGTKIRRMIKRVKKGATQPS
jgi:hypothetical protein